VTDFYYCSEEVSSGDLPVGCTLVRYLALGTVQQKAAVIKTEHPIYDQRVSEWVVLAKGIETISQVFEGKTVGVYLMPLDERAAATNFVLLDEGLQPVQDWGALAASKDLAENWQFR
jgi:hypothetical protein